MAAQKVEIPLRAIMLTLQLAEKGVATRGSWKGLVGLWNFVALFRRESYCLFDSV